LYLRYASCLSFTTVQNSISTSLKNLPAAQASMSFVDDLSN